jgi:hypothetical protein
VLRRPLNAVAAVVRFADDPKLLAVEWEDGAPPCQFVTPARDAVLAALLSAAQAASGRPIAVMPGGWWQQFALLCLLVMAVKYRNKTVIWSN